MYTKQVVRSLVLSVSLCIGLYGCDPAMLDSLLKKPDTTEKILAPSSADVSPDMDFTKIASVAVFPLFPSGGVGNASLQYLEDPAYADSVCEIFTSELTQKQSQWKIYGQRDTLAAINKHSLGRGYKNFQADYNTASGQINAFVPTKATKDFLKQLAAAMKVDAFIFGSYNLASGTAMVRTVLGPVNRVISRSSVNVALFQTKRQNIWWRATSTVTESSKEKLSSAISKSLASYVGKGTLRRL